MTHTRYIIQSNYDKGIYLSCEEWDFFKESIKVGCFFTLSFEGRNRPITIKHKFTVRYYLDNQYKYCHISNDDRRTILRYIEQNNDELERLAKR